jgi:TRAP-type C4-dicarboxylate transport system substrate-binding protein
LNSLEQVGLVGLSWYEAGTRSFYSAEEPIECLEDLNGKVIRVQDSDMKNTVQPICI